MNAENLAKTLTEIRRRIDNNESYDSDKNKYYLKHGWENTITKNTGVFLKIEFNTLLQKYN